MITPKSLWDDALTSLQSKINVNSYDVWIKNLTPVAIENNKLIILTDFSATVDTINRNYIDIITEAVVSCGTFVNEVEVLFKDNYVEQAKAENDNQTQIKKDKVSLIKRYTFDTFVVGDSNKFVHAAAFAVAQEPGTRYNPLFIYGGVGLGKTHIMHAIGNHMLETDPDINLVYTTSEKFTNEFINALRSPARSDMQNFKDKFRSADILMIDDVQFFENKQSVQEELFHTFNELHNNNKQIILTSDRMPKDIPSLEERLRTRFEWGIIADVQPPSIETKVAILQMKAAQDKNIVPNEVLYLIAERIESNIREMESLLSRVVLYSKMLNKDITVELAQDSLKDYIKHRKSQMSADTIIDAVCKYFDIVKAELIAKKKTKEVVEARHIAMYLILEYLSLPLASIGQIFGGRDYSTVIHARDKITGRLKTEKKLGVQLNDIRNMIQGA